MTLFGVCKGFYDSGILPRCSTVLSRASAEPPRLMNTVGWGGGALGPLFVGMASKYGGRPTEMENMSEAISFGGVIYLGAALLLLVAIFGFARRDVRHLSNSGGVG